VIKTLIVAAALLASSGAAHAVPIVSGNTISWPDDGWYQVQTADDYTSICGGGTHCDVEPGTYIVINHTTGERFENIVVTGVTTESAIAVLANTIFWLDDGWYQVQSATDYTSVCEGGYFCEVADGIYIVINHTTGERFENIVVPGDDGRDSVLFSPARVPVILAGLSRVINNNASVQVHDDLSDLIIGNQTTAPGRTIGQGEPARRDSGESVFRHVVECDLGGNYIYDNLLDQRGVADILINQCVIGGTVYGGGVFAANIDSGTFVVYTDFSVNDSLRDLVISDGTSERFTFRGVPVTEERLRNLAYSETDGDGTVRVEAMEQLLSYVDAYIGAPDSSILFETNFQVAAPWTDGRLISISTKEVFTSGANVAGGHYVTGTLQIEDEEGNLVLIDAATDEPGTYALMITQDGVTTSSMGRWAESFTLPCIAPENVVLAGCAGYSRLPSDLF
jgi:hypothetical protein